MVVEVQKVPSGPSMGRLTDKAKQLDYAPKMVVWGTFWKALLVEAHPRLGYYVYCWHLLWFPRVVHQICSTPVAFVLEAGSDSVIYRTID